MFRKNSPMSARPPVESMMLICVFLWCNDAATHKQSHARTHAHTHARTHARTHTHTHTHTHTPARFYG